MTQFRSFKDYSVMAIWFTFCCFIFVGHGFAEKLFVEDVWSGEDLREMGGYGEERLSTVLVTGSVLCEACLHGDPQLHAWPVSGAVVGVACHNSGKKIKSSDWVRGVADEFGDFIIDIPSHLHATPSFEKYCSVKILRVPKNTHCKPAHFAKHERVRLSSFGSGIRTYTSGILRLQHQTSKPLQGCIKKESRDQQSIW